MDTGLKGKTVLLTGASGGIGQSIARLFDKEEARLVLGYRTGEKVIRELSRSLEGESLPLAADLTREEEIDRMFRLANERFGRVEILIASAGIYPSEYVTIGDMSIERWEGTIRSDLTSVFLCCRAFFRNLQSYPGDTASIILIGSTAAQFGDAGHADYATAKSGIAFGLTLSLKNEITQFAKWGRVNCVCPGWTVTPMAEYLARDEKLVDRVFATSSLLKLGKPEDVAASVLFLASDNLSGHITGEILTVAGGMEGRMLRGDVSIKRRGK